MAEIKFYQFDTTVLKSIELNISLGEMALIPILNSISAKVLMEISFSNFEQT